MKISAKLLLITFAVVVSITGISAIIYYSLANSLLESQYSKSILNSSSDFANYIQPLLKVIDSEGEKLAKEKNSENQNLKGFQTDFFFKIENDSLIDFASFKISDSVYLNRSSRLLKTFVRQNRNVILRASHEEGNLTYFYGKAITELFLNRIAEKIRAEIAFLVNDNLYEISHPIKNRNYTKIIAATASELKEKNNFELRKEFLEDSDFMASIYKPKSISVADDKITFLVFNNNIESSQFRSTIKLVLIIIISSGIALALILILLFTTKIRKQIYLLNEGAEITAKGNLEHRVKVITKDEIGRFSNTFNKMLNELEVIKYAEKEYLDFLTLLNQNPSLKEISEAVLTKIIKGTNLTFGIVYLVEGKEMSVISSHGVSSEFVQPVQSANFYSKAIEEKENIEFTFSENYPEIRTGLAYIKIKYLLIFPVIYNKEVIAIIEVASETLPKIDVKKYLGNIHDQLAIGLINAKSLYQLENYIDELKKLNEEYQKQNIQITGQNEKLIELHNQLKEKAQELEEKRNQAVLLTKVKSQFLANMSHELKTPLISIIGLTDLTIKEQSYDIKMRDRLKVVFRNGKKLLNMINNILEFSKFEAGTIEVKTEVFLLNELLNEIKDNIQPIAKEKGLLFAIRNIKGEVLLSTDRTLLERVLSNLLFNAVKFTEKGNVDLTISFTNKGEAEFLVSDTGIGISEENQKIIFEEFKQAEEGSTKTYGGAGLGLAICKRYVEMLGGKISVKSKVGSGSKFKVNLPKVVVELIESTKNNEIEESAFNLQRSNINTILMSKSESTNKLLQDYLNNYHIKLSHIKNIKELQKINPKNISTLFIDIDDESEGIWKVIGELKMANPALVLLVMRMVEEERVGYGLFIDDYIFGYPDISGWKNILDAAPSGRKIKNLCLVHSKKEGKRNQLQSLEGITNIYYSGWSSFNKYLDENKFDAVVVEMLEPEHNSIELIYNLRKIKNSKNIYLMLNFPESVGENDAMLIYNEINELTLKAKYHPIDVLKVVRDKMGLVEESEYADPEDILFESAIESVKSTERFKKILIVDDDKDTLFTIGELINGIGFEVMYAHNGIECLSILEKTKPDLILLDIMMPQMDGFETIKRIRNNTDNNIKNIAVAALTAYEMLDNREVIENNGFNDLITKPIDTKSLAFKIEKLLMVTNEKDISN